MSQRTLDVCLLSLAILFTAFVIFGNDDPAARIAILRGWLPESDWHAKAIYKFIYDFGVSGLASMLFYALLVRLPELRKRRRMRRNLERQYRNFKRDCLYEILGIVNVTIDPKLVTELEDQKSFKTYFKTQQTAAQDRWHVFLNNIQEHHLASILQALERLYEEVTFTVETVDIPDDETFEFFKQYQDAMHAVRSSRIGYDEIKPLSRFLWEVLSGFNFVTGYRGEDVVAKMIRAI